MLFRPIRSRDSLQRALHAAIAAHRPLVLRHLLATHGVAAFAAALSPNSARAIADALSLLPAEHRETVACRLHPTVHGVGHGARSTHPAQAGISRIAGGCSTASGPWAQNRAHVGATP